MLERRCAISNRYILLIPIFSLFIISCERTGDLAEPEYEQLPSTILVTPELSEKIADLLFEEIRKNELIGLQVSLRDIAGDTWRYSAGSTDLKRNNKLQNSHIFRIGSITKMYTATVILKLAELDELELETKLSEFYPDFPDTEKITVRNLLNHSSGLIDIFELPDLFIESVNFPGKFWNPNTIAETCLSKGIKFEPGSRTHYSSANFILLSLIAEKVTGMNILELYKFFIFDPLSLRNTFFVPYEDPPPMLINGYVLHMALSLSEWYVNTPDHISWATAGHAAGAIVSTSEELSNFVHSLFNGNIITEYYNDMTTFLEDKGLGIFRLEINDKIMWGHSGQLMGFECITAYDPANSITYSLCCNTSPYNITDLLRKIESIIAN